MNTLRGISGRSLTYNTEDQLVSVGGTNYYHNADGYLWQKVGSGGTTSYTYSTRGELLTATLPDTRVISYVYDPLGRRIAKKINGSTTEKYLWSGLTRLLAVYDGSDNLLMRFEYADGRMPVSMVKGGTTYYLSYNQVGTLRAAYNSSGSIVKRVDYDSFGNIITDTAPTFTVPFGFAGGLHDRDTNLVHFGYRDYDPETGRWTAKDPIGFDGGALNLYGYCLEDPVNFVDPFGLYGFPNAPWAYAPPTLPDDITNYKLGNPWPQKPYWYYLCDVLDYMGNLYMYVGMAAAMANAYPYGGWPNLIGNMLFRVDPKGVWGKGQNQKGLHIHFDLTGTGRLMRYHLPNDFGNWWGHFQGIIKEWWRNWWRNTR